MPNNKLNIRRIADKLAITATLYDALIMTISPPYPTLSYATTYKHAMTCLKEYGALLDSGELSRPVPNKELVVFISDTKMAIINHAQCEINKVTNDTESNRIASASLAALTIISLFDSDYATRPVHHLITDAINYLDAAIFWATPSNAKEQQGGAQ